MPAAAYAASSTPVNLSKNSGLSQEPVVNSVGSNVYVAWEDNTSSGRNTIYFVNSHDGGSIWNPIQQLSGKGGAESVQMAATGNYVFLVWKQNGQTAFAASKNSGDSFGPVITFSFANGKTSEPSIATNGTAVYIGWQWDSTINSSRFGLMAQSYDDGATFTSVHQFASISVVELQVAASGDYVYAVWDSIYASASADGGRTFSAPQKLSDPNCSSLTHCVSREPMVAVSGSYVYVTWPSDPNGVYQGNIRASSDHGQTWAPTVTFAAPQGVQKVRELQVATCSSSNQQVPCGPTSNVYVTFRAQSVNGGTVDQWIAVSHNYGASFTLTQFTQKKGQLGFGGIAVDGTNVYVFWGHQGKGGIGQMFMQASTDGGNTWGSVIQQVSDSATGTIGMYDSNQYHDQGPIVSASDGMAFMVWQDMNGDVYFSSA